MSASPSYYDELAFLLENGPALAARYPRVADGLNLGGPDPDVERLLEGLAYGVSEVGACFADQQPLLFQLAAEIFFPHYLSPIPAACILAFESNARASIPAGTEVESVPVDGTRCRFRTIYDVNLDSTAITQARVHQGPTGSSLDLLFRHDGGPMPAEDRTRVYLHGESNVTASVYKWLSNDVQEIAWLDPETNVADRMAPIQVRPLGFEPEHALLDYPIGSPQGLRILQEYFAFKEKFLFFDLVGVFSAARRKGIEAGTFGLRFHLGDVAPTKVLLTERNFRLGATPAVNLFSHTSDPVTRRLDQSEIPIRPAGLTDHYAIYRVLRVVAHTARTLIEYPMVPMLDEGQAKEGRIAQIFRKPEGASVHTRAFLVDKAAQDRVPQQTIMADLLCTNHLLPRSLRLGDVGQPLRNHPDVGVRNITAVTKPTPPPLGSALRDAVVRHLTMAFLNPASMDFLQAALFLYHVEADSLAASLEGIQNKKAWTRYRGDLVQGMERTLLVDGSRFENAGELYLFGAILNELIASFSPLNTFSEFALQNTKNGETNRWPKRVGRLEMFS